MRGHLAGDGVTRTGDSPLPDQGRRVDVSWVVVAVWLVTGMWGVRRRRALRRAVECNDDPAADGSRGPTGNARGAHGRPPPPRPADVLDMERHVVPSAVTSVLVLLGAALGAALLAWLVLGGGWGTPAAIGAGTVLGLTLTTVRQKERTARG